VLAMMSAVGLAFRLLRIALLQFLEAFERNVMTPNRETVLGPASSEADRFNELRDQIDAMLVGLRSLIYLARTGTASSFPTPRSRH